MTASLINGIVAIAIFAGILVFFAYHSYTFLKDIRFYRRVNWDLSQDTGNRIFLLERMRQSVIFGRYPVGYLRLKMGYHCFVFGLILVFFFPLFWLLHELSSDVDLRALNKKGVTLAYLGFALAFVLLTWTVEFWLQKTIGWKFSKPVWIEKYVDIKLVNKLRVTIWYVFFVVVILTISHSVYFSQS